MNALDFAGLTDRGLVREHNQDRWTADPEDGLFIVSDGMGGRFAGELASKIVVEVLPPLLKKSMRDIADLSDPRVKEKIIESLTELSNLIRNESKDKPGLDGMGATVVLALIKEYQAVIAHMGDSRAYLLRNGRLEQITKDHSLIQLLLDCGEITKEEAPHHPARGQLTRYVGMEGEPLPEAQWLKLYPRDRLLLCSDGLTGMLSDEELLAVFQKRLNPKSICKRLIAAANASGGKDNITALVVLV